MPLIQISQSNPCADGRQSERAMDIRCGTVRHFEEKGLSLLPEMPLANGRRADLAAIDRKGRITIIEIKSSVEDFRVDRKWPEYLDFCDRFFFATGRDVPTDIFPEDQGLIVADRFDAAIIRDSAQSNLASASRKAITLRFARLAASRLERLTRFGWEKGFGLDDRRGNADPEPAD